MAVETLAGGHCCLLFLAAGQREQEKENRTKSKNWKNGKCFIIVQVIFSPSRQATERPIFSLFFQKESLK